MNIRPYQGISPRCEENVYVDPAAVVIGDVSLGRDSSVWPMASIRGDVHKIVIGERTNIQDNCTLHVTHDSEYVPGGHALLVGDEVTVGHNVVLHACKVGNRCLIGMNSTVLDGAVLDDEVMLGANALVPPGKHLEGGFLYVGSPVKKVRPLSDEEKYFLKYSAESYVKLKNSYAACQ